MDLANVGPPWIRDGPNSCWTDPKHGSRRATLTQNYTYDAVNRLWTFAETGSTGSQTYNTNQNYNYDAFATAG